MLQISTVADQYAMLKAEAEQIAKKLETLRKQILATGQETVKGDFYTVEVGLSERSSLDTKAVKNLLTPAQIAEVTKTSLVETLRVKAALRSDA